jgi:hypothetical protein
MNVAKSAVKIKSIVGAYGNNNGLGPDSVVALIPHH